MNLSKRAKDTQIGYIRFMTSLYFVKYNILQSNSREKTLDINGIGKCFFLVT